MDGDKNASFLNELHTDLLGKLFIATLGAWLVGKAVGTKLRGDERQVKTVANALVASRAFQNELRKPGASVQSVMDKLGVKHMAAKQFEMMFGVPFPL